ncbi:MAG: AEC family transporter [Spirochaetaceae bacterium]|jgi:predicted permease|nr:AEC family transporter [Spirochaetaceae bacterium]
MVIIGQLLVLFMLILSGFILVRTGALGGRTTPAFSSLVMNFSLPCLIIVSLQRPFSAAMLGIAGKTLGVSFFVYGLSALLTVFYPGLLGLKGEKRDIHRYALIFSNCAFIGIPMVEMVMGRDYLFQLTIYNIPFNLFSFSLGAWLITRKKAGSFALSYRTFLSPCIIATLTGFILFLFSVSLPGPLYQGLKMAGDMTSPLSTLVIGMNLAGTSLRGVIGSWRPYVTSLVRIAVMPLIVALPLYLAGIRGAALVLPVLVAAMPVAASAALITSAFDGDSQESGALVFLSTLFSALSLPLAALIIYRLAGSF